MPGDSRTFCYLGVVRSPAPAAGNYYLSVPHQTYASFLIYVICFMIIPAQQGVLQDPYLTDYIIEGLSYRGPTNSEADFQFLPLG